MDNRMTITRNQKLEEKQLYGRLKRLINNISHEKTWTWLRKGNLKRETDSPNCSSKQRHKNQSYQSENPQNSKCKLCADREKTINHVISECSKLVQKEYESRHGWVGKVIHWEMCKKYKFDHTNKWYMHNSASVLENDTRKFFWDFDIQTDHLISARSPDLIIINKKENL